MSRLTWALKTGSKLVITSTFRLFGATELWKPMLAYQAGHKIRLNENLDILYLRIPPELSFAG